MLKQLTDWLFSLIQSVFTAAWDFIVDIFVHLLDLVLGALVALLASVPVPAFMSGGLQSVFAQVDPGILFFVTSFGIPQVFAMYGAAYLFRFARKVVTLFQW
jgi:hypothetical protein